jgi:N-acetylglutamate synthase-like GNAT family acetyltransferase
VREQIQEEIDATAAEVVMLEAIKLVEGKLVEMVDQVWVTRAQRKVQIERLMVCRGMDAETAVMRVDAQNPQEAKVAWADVVIDADGTMADTRAQFELAWARLTSADSEPRVRAAARPSSVAREDVEPVPATPPAPGPGPEEPQAGKEEPLAEDVVVRRARPSDIPGILLLIQKATDGALQMKRNDLLMAFGERSYLIGQQDAQINTVIGWNTSSTTAVAIDQIFAHPLEAVRSAGPAVLAEIEKSARELICEVSLVYLPPDVPDVVQELFLDAGYERRKREEMPRAWQETVAETQPEGTFILAKVLRDIRLK